MIENDAFDRAFSEARLPSAVGMIVDRDGIRYAKAFGLRDVESGTPVELDTPFQIASMTKAITSVAAVQLVDRRAYQEAVLGAAGAQTTQPYVFPRPASEGAH